MALTIYCDESGYTGPNLFLDDQRYYVYASVGMPHDQAVDIVAKMRADSRTQVGELKFEKLSKYPRGRDAVRWFLETHGEKIAVFHADKRYSSAGKFFEYTFEPVLRPKRQLFYDIHFHRFVSTIMFDAWQDGDPVARELLEDGQNLIRFKKPEDLKRLLREPFATVSANCGLKAHDARRLKADPPDRCTGYPTGMSAPAGPVRLACRRPIRRGAATCHRAGTNSPVRAQRGRCPARMDGIKDRTHKLNLICIPRHNPWRAP